MDTTSTIFNNTTMSELIMVISGIYDNILAYGFASAAILAILYFIIAFSIFMVMYSSGEEIPELEDPIETLTKSLRMINPFVYRHPLEMLLATVCIAGGMMLLSMGWPILLPGLILWRSVHQLRKVNLSKKEVVRILSE